MSEPKLLVLGLGTTLGIVVQAVVLLPALRRIGLPLPAAVGLGPAAARRRRAGLWAVVYVLIGQAGYIVTTRIAAGVRRPARSTVYANAWLLLQVPYGVLGVSLLTALMPRMSRAAAEGRIADVVADLSLGSRLAAVFLIPVSALLTVFGPEIGTRCSACARPTWTAPRSSGAALAVSAFGLLPVRDHAAADAGVLRDDRQPHPDARCSCSPWR